MGEDRRKGWKGAASSEEPGPPPCDPIASANAILAKFPIRAPEDICIELMAAACDAFVVPRRTGSADARVVRDGRYAYIGIDPEALGTARGRFSAAHELAHDQMHRGWYDAIERVHGAPRTRGREYRVEREADACASELLLPRFLFLPMCVGVEPTLDNVSKVASRFRTSLTATARKWAELSGGACAFVESRGGVVKEAKRGAAFRGTAVLRRTIEEGTAAAELGGDAGVKNAGTRVVRVHDGERRAGSSRAWGSAYAGGAIVEESLRIAGTGTVLTWLWHVET